MGWSAIIAALIQTFLPMLLEWLQKWLDSRLSRAAEKLPAFASYGSEHDARDALFDQAITDLPRFAYARRALLTRLKAAARAAGVTCAGAANPLAESDAEEIAALAGAADSE